MNMSVCCSEQQNTHELPCMYPWWKLGIFHEFTLFPCQHYTSCPWGHAVRAAGLQFRWARNDADVRLRPSTDICSQIAGKTLVRKQQHLSWSKVTSWQNFVAEAFSLGSHLPAPTYHHYTVELHQLTLPAWCFLSESTSQGSLQKEF